MKPMMNPPAQRTVLVWDLPVRAFHALLALSFIGAYVTAESERWRLVHVSLGYTVAALVAFRLVWGLLGTRHARFVDFVRGPKAVSRYVGSLLRGQPEHHAGHNPAGGLAIVALLLLALAVAGSGWAGYVELGGEWVKQVHEAVANLMLGVVVVHVAGVLVSSWLHRENLVRGMVTGRKLGSADEGIGNAWRPLGVLMLVAVLGFWAWQWQAAPAPQDLAAAASQRLDDDD